MSNNVMQYKSCICNISYGVLYVSIAYLLNMTSSSFSSQISSVNKTCTQCSNDAPIDIIVLSLVASYSIIEYHSNKCIEAIDSSASTQSKLALRCNNVCLTTGDRVLHNIILIT